MPVDDPSRPRIVCLAGATATGKSEVAVLLAEQLNGEIISVDSMQVYRGLDIGTAKPRDTDRRRAPHHLLDVAGLTESFDAAKFARLAREAVRKIQARGRLPVLCGGTGLYFKAFLDGLGDAPPADPTLRAEIEATPLADLLRELEQRDPAAFAAIDRKNPRRVIRAIEVIRLTGKPFSEQRAHWPDLKAGSPDPASALLPLPLRGGEGRGEGVRGGEGLSSSSSIPSGGVGEDAPSLRFFGLVRQPQDLHRRINTRVDLMFQRGLVDEVRTLLLRGLAENWTAMQAIGYRQVVEHLRGERPLPETIELVKIRTRQFAKRQMTWFRRHAPVNWLEVRPDESSDAVAGRIIQTWNMN